MTVHSEQMTTLFDSSPPTMFPLLRLPFLCLHDVIDRLGIVDLYHFSLLSKRAKWISKRKKGNRLEVSLYIYDRTMTLYKDQKYICEMIFEKNRFEIGPRKRKMGSVDIWFTKALQHFLDVFNCPFEIVHFELKPPLTEDQLIMIIDLLNGMKTEIKEVYIVAKCQRILDFLFSLNTEIICAYQTNLSSKELNEFLRSWKEGKTNQKVKQVTIGTCSERDVKEVLKGLGGELMDPRTATFKFREKGFERYIEYWIRGGIQIRGNDGRFAVIVTSRFAYPTKNEDVKVKHIQKYLKDLEMWNSENSAWNENHFSICFF
uniref:F-box domain-containing protein n=1 Tax=Caenorhabditis tropicalis TaxID=1561998 RepID=A0A1I7TCF9_9PELO